MIVTKARDYEKVKEELDPKKTIGIVSCNTCVRFCQTGGVEIMEDWKKKLTADGFKVVDTDLIGAPCLFQEIAATRLRGEITIVLACESGLHNLKEAFPGQALVAGLETVGLGAVDKEGKVKLVEEL